MCELLGLCFNKEVTIQLAFSGLKAGATENPDGWGVAWYDECGTQIMKEARPADRSRLAGTFLDELGARSRIFVSHIRRATAGAAGYPNTHPFYRRLYHKTWVFAHNGTMDAGRMNLPTAQFVPIGETDSELLFCHILSWVEERALRLVDDKDFRLLHEKLGEVNKQGELNVLLSDGEKLYVYHDSAGHVGLHYLLRQDPYPVARLRGQFLSIDLAEIIDPGERGYIVASKPLSDENWISIRPGNLMVFSEGRCLFNSDNGHSTHQGEGGDRPA